MTLIVPCALTYVSNVLQLLLGYKKRGLGKDMCARTSIVLGNLLAILMTKRYNGFGGKVDPGETPAEAAVRELKACYDFYQFYIDRL